MVEARRLPLIAAGFAVLVTVGCGGGHPVDDMSAEEITEKAIESLDGADSVRIAGTFNSSEDGMWVDFAVDTEGNCFGSLGMTGLFEIDYLATAADLWVKVDEDFWANFFGPVGSGVGEIVGDRYLFGGRDDPLFGELVDCDIDILLGDLRTVTGGESEISKGDVTTLDGVDVIELMAVDEDGEVSLFIEASGDFYLLKISAEGDEGGEVTFSDFDQPVEVERPDDDEVFDLADVYEELGL